MSYPHHLFSLSQSVGKFLPNIEFTPFHDFFNIPSICFEIPFIVVSFCFPDISILHCLEQSYTQSNEHLNCW